MLLRNRDKEPSTLFQPDGERGRFNFDSALTNTNIERHSRPYTSFSTYVFRNDKPSGRIHGTFHTMKNTTRAKHISNYKGRKVYFCCTGCKQTFDRQPEKYAV